MGELVASLAAAALWTVVFVLFAVHASRGRPGLHGPGILAGYAAFFAFQIVLAKVLGKLGLLSTLPLVVAYGLAAAAGLALYLRERGRSSFAAPAADVVDDTDPDSRLAARIVLGSSVAIVAGLAAFTILSPVHIWDALAYHMPMVATYVQNGSLEAWPTQDLRQIYRVNGGELQLLNIALLSMSDAWVELPSLLGFGVGLIATFELARLALRHSALPYLIVALVLATPQILLGAATAKNDLVFLAAVLCAFYWVIRAAVDVSDRTLLYVSLAGASGALAAATKVMGLNVLGAIGLLTLGLAARRRLPFKAVLFFGGTAALTLLVLVGDVYWSNFTRAAVPVGVAPNEVFFRTGPANLVAAAHYYLYDLSFRRLVSRQMFEHDLSHYGYFFPFLLALGLAAGVRQALRPRARRVALASLALIGAALFLSVIAVRQPISFDQRFMTWMVPTLAILAASFAERLASRHVLVLTTAAASFAVFNLFHALSNEADSLFTRSGAHLAATGALARYTDVPSSHYTFMVDGFDVVERTAQPRDSVLYVGTDDSWMYPAWGPRFTRHVRGVWNPVDAVEQVAARQHAFIVIEDDASSALRLAARGAAAEEGYEVFREAEGRVILRRSSRDSAGMNERESVRSSER